MGDKSPKSQNRLKKQDTAAKEQKKAAANSKAHPAQGALPAKKGR